MITAAARHGAALAASVLLVSACFSYVPTELESVPVGQDVQVYVTRAGMAELEQIPESGPILRGKLMARESDRISLRVPVATRQTGFYQSTVGQDVFIPVGEIVQIERRKLNGATTGLLVAGTAAGAAGIIYVIIEAYGRTETTPPDPEELRIPIFSIRFR